MNLEQIIEKYTALLWKITSHYLSAPEDIKECVNETFTRFYLSQEKFDETIASLPVYLTAIARKTAVSHLRKKKLSTIPLDTDVAAEDPELELAEIRADLDMALATLKPEDFRLIQMKYYGGMTIQEIAKSLNLPYETVKKRHQRALGKLRQTLLLIMILLLFALIGACGYRILRYYDIVPPLPVLEWLFTYDEPDNILAEPVQYAKTTLALPEIVPITEQQAPLEEAQSVYSFLPEHGVNIDTGKPSYKLYLAASGENEYVVLTLDEAFYMNDALKLSLTVRSKETIPLAEIENSLWVSSYSRLHYRNEIYMPHITHYWIDDYTKKVEVVCENLSFSTSDATIDLALETYDVTLPFSLVTAEEQSIETEYHLLKDHGGIMAIPRYENDELILRIYTMNTGKYSILPGLIYGSTGEREDGVITLTDAAGTVYSGSCVRYRPYSPNTYFDWNFGNVPPGEYTLHIPYLYQATTSDMIIPLDFHEFSNLNTPYEIPGGTVSVVSYERLETIPGENIEGTHLTASSITSACYWRLLLKCDSTESTHTITKLYFNVQGELLPEPDYGSTEEVTRLLYSSQNNDIAQGIQECIVMYDENVFDSTSIYLQFINNPTRKQDSINYRWNESFNLKILIE